MLRLITPSESFTGRAYGQVDATLTSDIGNAPVTKLTARPEVAIALDVGAVGYSHSQLPLSPRLFCERQIGRSSILSCVDGVEIGIRSQSEDGLSSANFHTISG